MKNSGIDIRKPGFEHIMPHLRALDKPDVLPVTGGEAIGKDPAYFLGGKIGVERDLFGNKVGEPSGPSGKGPKVVTEDSRYPGELKSINPLMSDTIKNLSQYHKVHNGLVDLVKRHKTDMTSGIRELMGMKQARTNWNNRRRSIIASGKEDPGEYKGMNIPGIKLKTGLYAYGMMGGGNCLDGETEALTRRGWVKGFSLKENDILLTKNPETGELEWQGMTSLNLFPDYEGDLVEFNARSFDAVTTPDHRWLVTSHGGSVKEKTSATITFNADRIHRTGSYVAPEISGLTPDEAELLGWFVTDGNYKKKTIKYGKKYHKPKAFKYDVPGKYAQLYQSISGNFEKCRRIDYLLERLDENGEVTSGVNNGSLKVWRLGPTLTNMLVSRAPDRHLTVNSLLDLNKECLDRLRESMVLGDGWVQQHKAHWTAHQALCTGRKEQAEAFQVLLTMTGSASTMEFIDNSKYDGPRPSMGGRVFHHHGIYIVRALVRECVMLEPKHRKEFRAKMGVWCPTVPNSFFVARRNGKVWITGNSVVPDTHFIRHMFGLDTHKDAKTLSYLKKALWNPSNYPIIEQYNDWYRKNHPAHKWMVNHPEFGKMFEKPEDATFPAFWANWMNIAPYEQKLGTSYSKQAHNMGSTHAPYWAAIAPHVNEALTRLGKSSDFDTTMPLRAALIMQHYVRDYGEVPAQMLYYQHLVPKLLECARNRQDSSDATDFLKKALQLEENLIELRKDIRHVVEGGHSVEMPEVYKINMHEENGKDHPAGRFMISKGKLHHLEDYHGLLQHMVPEGPVTAQTISRIHGLMASPHFDVQEHPMDTTHLEATDPAKAPTIPQVSIEKQPEPKRPGVFSYFRPGMSHPHVVEFTPQGAALDGKALTHEEVSLMLENARKGLAQIKWGAGEGLAKREATEDLMDQDQALQHVRAAVQAGHIHPSVERALTKHIYEDPLVGSIGNKYAAQKFREKNKPGVYISADANDFKAINDRLGHDAGDSAIKAFGGALRDASQKVGTTKVFRSGGDEFFIHAPSHEDASRFLRHARENVEALPPIGGVHKQSFSAGVGHNFAKADEALGIAKQGKLDPITKQRLHPPGQTPNLAHSLYPGHEGALMENETRPPKMAISSTP
jgi:diguanylate cyclase (GGDEF)-like protein